MKRSQKRTDPHKFDIRGVAALARVSIATVSRTINQLPTVDPVLAARVWKAIEELNYVPNTQARALVSGKSRMLGLIVSEITNPFFPELIQEFEREAVSRGYEILIGSTSYDRKKMDLCVRRMMERKVDGVAIMTFGIEAVALDLFSDGEVPTVFIDSAPPRPRSAVLSVDYRQGFFEAIAHLVAAGHEKIGFISGPRRLASAESRREAFKQSMRAHKLKLVRSWTVEGDHTLDSGREAMMKLLALEDRPTAVVCSNDMTAIGVQHALFEAKLRVPQDLSLIGFDDIHLAAYTITPLTTIRMGCKDLAHAAVASLLAHIQTGKPAVSTTYSIPTKLIVRQTTAPVRKKGRAGQ